jgi:small subunit ribosomal protein SAe
MATDGADSPLTLSEEDAMKMVVCEAHIGTTNVDYQGTQYVWKRRSDGVHIINVKKVRLSHDDGMVE